MMQKGKKAMSVLLMMGMLTTAGASLALAADAGGAEAPDRPRGGGMFLNEEWLTDEIAGLDAQQQAEILALQAELAALQPEKEPREKQALTTEEQAVLDEYQAQIQAKEEAITAILQEAGVTLTAPDKPDQTTIVRIFSEQADGAERTLDVYKRQAKGRTLASVRRRPASGASRRRPSAVGSYWTTVWNRPSVMRSASKQTPHMASASFR